MDFLLNKASQYSSFISRDLDELQAAMTDSAQRQAEKADKKSSKKRKGEGKAGKGGKKSKKNNGESGEALKTAQIKDAKNRKEGKKIIFTQPPNLSKGCVLKDYQLEGVRWLASLFENGVSGILADEVSQLYNSLVYRDCIVFQIGVLQTTVGFVEWQTDSLITIFNRTKDGTWKDDPGNRLDCAPVDPGSQWPISSRRAACDTAKLGPGIRKVAAR